MCSGAGEYNDAVIPDGARHVGPRRVEYPYADQKLGLVFINPNRQSQLALRLRDEVDEAKRAGLAPVNPENS